MTVGTHPDTPHAADEIDQLAVNTIRTLSIDAVQAANSGHPGTPMALAPVTYKLWQDYLRFDPELPVWANRDRFVLSVGHASALLYSMLHLAGVKSVNPDYEIVGEPAVSLEDLRRFRQLDSKCPGHPEYRWTSGVECTTGPLGTGIATSVGMAIAGLWQAATFNRPGYELFDYDVYALCGDGCLMEGIGAEAASLAGHLKLSNLCWIYDNNKITIEGATSLAFSEDVPARFVGYGWAVQHVSDANDLAALGAAFDAFRAETGRPTLIVVDSIIGYGSPNKAGTHSAHGEPLGTDEVKATKRFYGWPEDETFRVPAEVADHVGGGMRERGGGLRRDWEAQFARYAAQYPEQAKQLNHMQRRTLPDGWDADIPDFPADAKGVAGRDANAKVLNAVAARVPWLVGGSADLAPSNKSRLTFDGAGDFSSTARAGRNLHFGVREHAAAAVANGLALSKLRAYQAGFLIFSDFQRGALRLSALMELPLIHLYTHDSIGVGEDGPTHQPIEHLASIRAMPGVIDLRPGDANEVAEAWRVLMPIRHEPVALMLSRQALPTLDRQRYTSAAGLARGAYVLADPAEGEPDVILIATGSEVAMTVDAYERLSADGIRARVVSMPSMELFDKQPRAYRDEVLPPSVTARVSVEKGSTFGWDRWVGLTGAIIGMSTFGASAPLKVLQAKFGFTVEHIVAAARAQLGLQHEADAPGVTLETSETAEQ
jgi:transketolase